MPLDENKKNEIREHLAKIAAGEKPRPIDIGRLTQAQFEAINSHRSKANLPSLESAMIVYHGRHHYSSRSKDGYNIEDMISQLESGLMSESEVISSTKMTALQNKIGRRDGYGNHVKDQVILELTTRKPKAEAFSAIPKGDYIKPNKKPLC
jgi:hypothetical protein